MTYSYVQILFFDYFLLQVGKVYERRMNSSIEKYLFRFVDAFYVPTESEGMKRHFMLCNYANDSDYIS